MIKPTDDSKKKADRLIRSKKARAQRKHTKKKEGTSAEPYDRVINRRAENFVTRFIKNILNNG